MHTAVNYRPVHEGQGWVAFMGQEDKRGEVGPGAMQ